MTGRINKRHGIDETRNLTMNLRTLARAATAASFALVAGVAQAAVLFSQAPLPGINGIQSDFSTGALAQAFTVAPGQTLGSVEWYGYHLPTSFGPGSDAFTLLVNGFDVTTGALSLTSSLVLSEPGFDLYKYTLDIVDIPIASGSLELANGPDTQWAWQFSVASAELTAFTLVGSNATVVPEPAGVALTLLALMALAGCSRIGLRRSAQADPSRFSTSPR